MTSKTVVLEFDGIGGIECDVSVFSNYVEIAEQEVLKLFKESRIEEIPNRVVIADIGHWGGVDGSYIPPKKIACTLKSRRVWVVDAEIERSSNATREE